MFEQEYKYFEIFVRRHPNLNKIENEDLISELTVRYLEQVSKIQSKYKAVYNPQNYYLMILNNILKDILTEQKNRNQKEQDYYQEQKIRMELYPEEFAYYNHYFCEIADLLEAADLTVSEHIIFSAYYTGLSLPDIAVGIKENYETVKKRFYKARDKVLRVLSPCLV
jgi:RNA polymerase sigma factor (sigma-70 family)